MFNMCGVVSVCLPAPDNGVPFGPELPAACVSLPFSDVLAGEFDHHTIMYKLSTDEPSNLSDHF